MRSWMVGVVAGAVAAPQLPLSPGSLLSLTFVLCGCLALGQRDARVLVCCGVLTGLGLSAFQGATLEANRVSEQCTGRPLTVTGTVTSIPVVSQVRDATRRQRFDFELDTMAEQACVGPRRLELAYYGDVDLLPGQHWHFLVKLKRPWGNANPGSANLQGWYVTRGIEAVGHVLKPAQAQLLHSDADGRFVHHRVRLGISRALATLDLSPHVIAVLQAVTVADKSQIDDALWRVFRSLGIVHLLVISGLHVGLVAGVGYGAGALLLRLAPGGAPLGLLQSAAAFFPAALYTALAGFSLPTQRALAMLAVFLLGSLLARPGSGHLRLLAGAVVIVAINPMAPLGAGFWLSFGAVAVLLWFGACHAVAVQGESPRFLRRLLRQQGPGHRRFKWRQLIGVHGYMALAMLPLGAFFFGGGSLVAMFANMLMIPVIGFVVVPLALLGVLCHLLGWTVAGTFWQLAGWPLEQLLPLFFQLLGHSAGLMFAPLYGTLPVLCLSLTAVALLGLPGAAPARFVALVLLLPLLIRDSSDGFATPSPRTTVAFLDVGQGTAVVIHSGGRTLLYDTGGGNPEGDNAASRVVLPYLRARGISALDTFVVSHGDNDHSAGARAVLRALPARRVRYGGGMDSATGGLPCRAGEAWRWPGNIHFQFLSPAGSEGLSSNNASCVLHVNLAGWRLLLAGDIEARQERGLVAYWRDHLRAAALLAPHHGSGTSSSHSLLKTVAPQLGLFSAGYANGFGHPREAVVARFQEYGALALTTAVEGAVEIDIAGGEVLAVRRYRRGWRPYWW